MSSKSLPDTTMTIGQSADDFNLWKSSEQLFNMREFQPDVVVASDIYLGTKMNRKALDFHTQLHDWNESQKLSNLSTKQSHILTNAKSKDIHLPYQKLAHIDHWTKQVNRYYLPSRGVRPKSGSFMKIDVTKYNMKVDKNAKPRSQSALYRPASASDRFNPNARKSFFGNDFHTVKNNLVESQMHYSAQRREIHSATTRRSTKSTKNTKVTELDNNDAINNVEPDKESTNATATEDKDNSEAQVNGEDSTDVSHTENDNLQPQIVARSWSNRMLNVITIDDCKLTCRYRPQVIKENHVIPEDYDDLDRARANKLKKEVNEVTKVETNKKHENGNEADDEGGNSLDENDGDEGFDNELTKDNSIIDTNNNDACHKNNVKDSDLHDINESASTDTRLGKEEVMKEAMKTKENRYHKFDKTVEGMEGYNGHVRSESDGSDKIDDRPSSKSDSKTSYGRLTNLYSNSSSAKSNIKDRRKTTRTSRINYAIEDMVKERKVMNSLERDFESRTAPFGRTIVDKSEGSEAFKKRHAHLRKKIDELVNTHGALRTLDFYHQRRCNSASSSTVNS